MHKNLLDIIKGEASEDRQTSIQPDVLSESEGSDSSSWKNERGESRNSYECYACKEGSTEVEIFLLLGCSSDKGDRTHHCDCIKTSTGNESRRCHKEERSEEGTLGCVEGCPEGVFWDIATRY